MDTSELSVARPAPLRKETPGLEQPWPRAFAPSRKGAGPTCGSEPGPTVPCRLGLGPVSGSSEPKRPWEPVTATVARAAGGLHAHIQAKPGTANPHSPRGCPYTSSEPGAVFLPRALWWCQCVAGVKQAECFTDTDTGAWICLHVSVLMVLWTTALMSGCFCAGVVGPCVPSRKPGVPLSPQPLPGSQLPPPHPARSNLCQARRPQGCLFSPLRLLGFVFHPQFWGKFVSQIGLGWKKKKKKI